jgi:nudix-type nucleoside diphosphatase (YffH/AdpP family)
LFDDEKGPAAMAKRARILAESLVAEGRFRLTRTRVEVEEADGARRTFDHEIYRHEGAAAVLLYDPARGLTLLVKQFRLGAYLCEGALESIEACAGMLDGDEPEACVVREAFEETGVRIESARHAFDAFTSPGATTEKIACFVAPYGAADRVGPGGGVDADEHIEIVEIPFAQALAMIEAGEIRDAKTIALLYYAKAKGLFGSTPARR